MEIELILLLPAAYLLGSVPWGAILARRYSHVDVQREGSKNIGAFNVYRLAGRRLGIWTLAADISKGAVPLLVAFFLLDGQGWPNELALGCVALSAFMGHLYSLFLRFRGGKGVATAAGCVLVLSPMTFLVCMSIYILVVCIAGYSSLGSLAAATAMPLTIWKASHSIPITLCATIMTVCIFARHRDNIKRLLAGREDSVFEMH